MHSTHVVICLFGHASHPVHFIIVATCNSYYTQCRNLLITEASEVLLKKSDFQPPTVPSLN